MICRNINMFDYGVLSLTPLGMLCNTLYMECIPHSHVSTPLVGLSLFIIEVSRSHSARFTTFGRTPPEERSAVAETCT
jgi:hypothetical protein